MSTITIKGLNINYTQTGSGKDVVCMHGWGQNLEMMQMISEYLQNGFRVTSFDFPGFSKSDEPHISWGLEDYVDFFKELLIELKIENPILIGHSFGCRVAILYAASNPVHKMILTGAAGIRPKKSKMWYIRTYTYKFLKNIFKLPFLNRYQDQVKSKFGSTDYKQSSGVMRETLVKIVNSDVSRVLSQIAMPVLLVWGEKDESTPLWMGKQMEKEMKNAGLAIFENDDHFAYWNQWERFNRCLEVFLKEDRVNLND